MFLSRLALHQKIKDINASDLGLLEIYESANGAISDTDLDGFVTKNPEWDIGKINDEFDVKYPLIQSLNSYNYSQIIVAIAHYINLVDKS